MCYNTAMMPEYIKPFLWSYDTDKIDLIRDKQRIILNVLNLGTKQATDWLFLNYPKEEIKKVVKDSGAKGELSAKSLNYWILLLKIKERELQKTRF
jgi:hypothetical protein